MVIFEEPLQGIGQQLGIIWWNQQTGHAVIDYIDEASDCASHNGPSCGHCFKSNRRTWFLPCGRDNHNAGRTEGKVKFWTIQSAGTNGEAIVWSARSADVSEHDPLAMINEDAMCMEQNVESLGWVRRTNKQYRPVFGNGKSFAIRIIDEVRNDLNMLSDPGSAVHFCQGVRYCEVCCREWSIPAIDCNARRERQALWKGLIRSRAHYAARSCCMGAVSFIIEQCAHRAKHAVVMQGHDKWCATTTCHNLC